MQLMWRDACSTPVNSVHLLCASERSFLHAWVVILRASFVAVLQKGLTATSAWSTFGLRYYCLVFNEKMFLFKSRKSVDFLGSIRGRGV